MSGALRIAVDARYIDAGYSGIGYYSRQILAALSRLDRESTYDVLVHASAPAPPFEAPNFRWHRIPARPLSFATLLGMERVYSALRSDLLWMHYPVTPLRHRGPLVVTVHDLQPLLMPEWSGRRPWPIPAAYRAFYAWQYARSIQRAAHVFTDSAATRQSLVERWPSAAARTSVAHCALTPQPRPANAEAIWARLQAAHRIPQHFVLYYGSTRPNKNLPGMLEAFARSPDRDLAFVLALTPDRFMDDVNQAIARNHIEDRVRILPPIAEDEKRVLLERAAALFFVTRLEGFGFPILEAQAAGTPVIAANVDSAPEVAGEGALLVNPNDPAAILAGLREITSAGEARARLVAAGTANLRRFSWDRAAAEVLTALRTPPPATIEKSRRAR